MISIKRFLDWDDAQVLEPNTSELSSAIMECYRAALTAFSKTAGQISPELAPDLERRLSGLEGRLCFDLTRDSLTQTAKQVDAQLFEWGSRASDHFKAQTESVKELLLALAKTAESVGSRNEKYSSQFKNVTEHLEKIGDLNDLAQIRSSLVHSVSELKNNVEKMTRENTQLVSSLQAEASIYETRLRKAEHLAFKDELTGLSNRRGTEERIKLNIMNRHEFCILLLDLNQFKEVNDQYGHLAGDNLLKQFAMELQAKTRPGDLVGRWGGDEFIVVLMCSVENAGGPIQRIRDWVFGKYTIEGSSKGSIVAQVDAAIGVAGWSAEKDLQKLIDEADAAMYSDKRFLK